MCDAVILGLLAFLAFQNNAADNRYFWLAWAVAIIFNTNWWRKIEDKALKGE